MSSNEQWLSVPGYPGYEISDQGQVRSLDREGRGRWGPRKFKGQILTQVMVGGPPGTGGRYHACTLYQNGKPKQVVIHILVLEVFVGPRPEGMCGCHRDDDPDNNRLKNLYWGTPTQNARDAVNNGLCAKSKITHCPHGHEYTKDNTYIVRKSGHRQCRACIKARNKGNANNTRTHCPQGHPYDKVNTYRPPRSNRRICRACTRNRSREYQRSKRLTGN
jgi:hypothetical protein